MSNDFEFRSGFNFMKTIENPGTKKKSTNTYPTDTIMISRALKNCNNCSINQIENEHSSVFLTPENSLFEKIRAPLCSSSSPNKQIDGKKGVKTLEKPLEFACQGCPNCPLRKTPTLNTGLCKWSVILLLTMCLANCK